jgi:hypothetical protein
VVHGIVGHLVVWLRCIGAIYVLPLGLWCCVLLLWKCDAAAVPQIRVMDVYLVCVHVDVRNFVLMCSSVTSTVVTCPAELLQV